MKQIIYDVLFLEPTDAENDGRLAEAIAMADNVILPFTFGRVSNAGDVGPIYPIAQFARSAQAMGYVSADPDPDGCGHCGHGS